MTRLMMMTVVGLGTLLAAGAVRAQEATEVTGTLEAQGDVLCVARAGRRLPLAVRPDERDDLRALAGRQVTLAITTVWVPTGRARTTGRVQEQDGRLVFRVAAVLNPSKLTAVARVSEPAGPGSTCTDLAPRTSGPAAALLEGRNGEAVVVRGWLYRGQELVALGVQATATRRVVVRGGPSWLSFPARFLAPGDAVWLEGRAAGGFARAAGGGFVRPGALGLRPAAPTPGLAGALGR